MQDVIVAVSTGAGRAAIGVVRLSGEGSISILDRLTGTDHGPPRRPALRLLTEPSTGDPLDRAMVWWGSAPATYTGEDLVEIHAHGNPLILDGIVAACCELGARRAEPGEFTRRALDHGKVDLAGAEAILAAVEATSIGGARLATRALGGALGERIADLRGELINIAATVEAAVDFEDDVGDIDVGGLLHRIAQLAAGLREMSTRVAEAGRLLAGADVALLGPVNAGKSTLFNRLVGEQRSIVHAEPGTTRDVVTADREIEGLRVRFHDTAGLREGATEVEGEGVARARSLRYRVDLVLYVLDATRPGLGTPESDDLVVVNKSDRCGAGSDDGLAISALSGDGLEVMLERIGERLGRLDGADAVLWTGRQGAAAATAAAHLERAGEQLTAAEYGPAAADLSEALRAVQDILGIDPDRAVLDELFSQFCIGK